MIDRYEGEWHNNKKHGYGVTTFRDGTKEEGKYKYNVLVTSQKKKHLFLIRSAKFRERIDAAVSSAQRASKYALQKADIAVSRMATARSKGESADSVSELARVDSEIAVATAREFAPDFKPSVLERFERIRARGNHNHQYRSPGLDPMGPLPNAKSPFVQQTSMNMTPNHMSMAQASSDSTPQKQISFPPASQRRTSLQKQVSVDYPTIGAGGPSPQNQFPTSSLGQAQMSSAQYQHQAYPSQSQYNGGIQNVNSFGPNQNYQGNAMNAHQQFNNSNYMSNNSAAAAAQYGSMQYGSQQQSQIQTQFSQQSAYGANQAAYSNYNNLGNQMEPGYAQDAEYARSKAGYGPQNPGNMLTFHMSEQPAEANIPIIVTGIQGNFSQLPQQQMQNSAGC